MPRYATLPDHIKLALESIIPSEDAGMLYYPCRATLKSGQVLDAVYIEPEDLYLRAWGIYPEDDKEKRSVLLQDIATIGDSPTRLPAHFANEIYERGESGMGYTKFTVMFRDDQQQSYVTGNAVDFISYPHGKGPRDVVAVEPFQGPSDCLVKAPEWYWCLYSDEQG